MDGPQSVDGHGFLILAMAAVNICVQVFVGTPFSILVGVPGSFLKGPYDSNGPPTWEPLGPPLMPALEDVWEWVSTRGGSWNSEPATRLLELLVKWLLIGHSVAFVQW